MKRTIASVLLSLAILSLPGQACGTYRLRFIGTIASDSVTIKEVKLPTTRFLQGKERWDSDGAFFTVGIEDSTLNCTYNSHLTSVFTDPQILIQAYQRLRSSLPIIIIVDKDGRSKEIIKEIPWDAVQLETVKDEEFGMLFELKLVKIIL